MNKLILFLSISVLSATTTTQHKAVTKFRIISNSGISSDADPDNHPPMIHNQINNLSYASILLRKVRNGSYKAIGYGESSFGNSGHCQKFIFNGSTSIEDTVSVNSIIEFHIKGPQIDIPSDSVCFTLTVYAGDKEQVRAGFYLGEGKYVVQYTHRKAETLSYKVTSDIPDFPEQCGQLIVSNPKKSFLSESRTVKSTMFYSNLTIYIRALCALVVYFVFAYKITQKN